MYKDAPYYLGFSVCAIAPAAAVLDKKYEDAPNLAVLD